ncbi:unnamed protein product [Microthlaspi erraticum]|uniref:Oligopeptidase A N-terminal domain-containing protein n=1 Tax=Microthlaspi erraticum TaxID=1685480 RepID=A0A6D2IDE6_9BRAS|nr:unnamed protein product [Microthlaspi erraticum]
MKTRSDAVLVELWTGPMFVRKSWLTVCRDTYLWSTFDLEPWFESYPESTRLWSPDFELKIDSMLRSVVDWSHGGLTEIRVRHCSDLALSYTADRWSNLQVLAVRSSPNLFTFSSSPSMASEDTLSSNPLLQNFEFPPFDTVDAHHVGPGIRALLQQLEAELEQLEKSVEPSWPKLVVPFDGACARLLFGGE